MVLLGEDLPVLLEAPREGLAQVDALHRPGDREAGGAEQRRRDIDQAGDSGLGARSRPAFVARPFDEQRDVDLLVVEREAVPEAAVLGEFLAVVGGQRDQRVVVEALLFELREQLPELGVEMGDLAAIELGEPLGLLRFRIGERDAGDADAVVGMLEIGIVRIHVVQEEEEALVAALFEPLEGDVVHDLGVLVEIVEPDLLAAEHAEHDLADELIDDELRARLLRSGDVVGREVVVVVVALGEAEALGEVHVRDDAARRIAALLHRLGDQRQLLRERGGLRHRAMGRGQGRGQQRGRRGLGPRRVGECRVARALIGEAAEVRRRDGPAMTREMVRAQGIDHHEDHVRLVGEPRGDRVCRLRLGGGRGEGERERAAEAEDAEDEDGDGRERRREARRDRRESESQRSEDQREHDCAAREYAEHDRQRRHLLEIDVAAQSEKHDEEPERHEARPESEPRHPAPDLETIHREHREEEPAQDREPAEHRRPHQGPVPEHLRVGPEPALRDHDRLAESEQETRRHPRERPRRRAAPEPLAERRRRDLARLYVDVLLEGGRRTRRRGIIDLDPVDARERRRVVGAARPPEQEAQHRRRFRRPEAERRRQDRLCAADLLLQQHVLRGLADALARDREGADHGHEDLDRRPEGDLPEIRADRADRERGVVVHRRGREVDQEREKEDLQHQARS